MQETGNARGGRRYLSPRPHAPTINVLDPSCKTSWEGERIIHLIWHISYGSEVFYVGSAMGDVQTVQGGMYTRRATALSAVWGVCTYSRLQPTCLYVCSLLFIFFVSLNLFKYNIERAISSFSRTGFYSLFNVLHPALLDLTLFFRMGR